ncbi:MAG: hypothetical protein IK124_10295 [Prevotella sp.]|nr:hypothetical protein [Prevotella sp.]
MKNYYITITALVFSFFFIACTSDKDLEDPITIIEDYQLDQGAASAADNARIKQLYEKYGSYFVYSFTQQDANWIKYTGKASSRGTDYVIPGNPANVGKMLDYVNDIWLKYLSDDVLKNGGIPYRVFLADSCYNLIVYDPTSSMKTNYNHRLMTDGNSIIIAGMNRLDEMTEAEKKTEKVALISDLINYYIAKGIMTFPQEFFDVTDYVNEPRFYLATPNAYSYTLDAEDFYNRGFLPQYYSNSWGSGVNFWLYKYTSGYSTWGNSTTETIMNNDRTYYMTMILNCTDDFMATYLKYPLINTKWNIIINHFKNNYGLDLRAIAN